MITFTEKPVLVSSDILIMISFSKWQVFQIQTNKDLNINRSRMEQKCNGTIKMWSQFLFKVQFAAASTGCL